MAAKANLLVTPEELDKAASAFDQSRGRVNRLTSDMMQIVRGLSSTWLGEANKAYTSKFNSLEDDMSKLNRMIQEHVEDLKQISANYKKAESTNTQSASSLASNIIS